MSATCALYSFVGLIFLFWVSVMLEKQPFFMTGFEDPEEAKNNAYGAMGLFALTFVYSMYKVYNPAEAKEEQEAVGMEGYQLNTEVPNYGTR